MEYRYVTHAEVPDLATQMARLTNLAFAEYEGAPQVDAAFMEWYGRRPGCTPGLCPAVLYGDRLVSSVTIALQRLNLGGEFVLCGLIDNVATDPEHRQQGLARRLMEAGHKLLRERHAEAAVLYTNPENHPYRFYGRLGYLTRSQAGLLTATRPSPAGACRVRVATSEDWPAIRQLVNARYSSYEGFARLDDDLWRWHRADRPPSLPVMLAVAERDGRLVGTIAHATIEVMLEGEKRRVVMVSDAVYPDAACLQDLLAVAPGSELAAIHDLKAAETGELENLDFDTSVGEVSMVLPFTDHAGDLLSQAAAPWYVMVESVVGV